MLFVPNFVKIRVYPNFMPNLGRIVLEPNFIRRIGNTNCRIFSADSYRPKWVAYTGQDFFRPVYRPSKKIPNTSEVYRSAPFPTPEVRGQKVTQVITRESES